MPRRCRSTCGTSLGSSHVAGDLRISYLICRAFLLGETEVEVPGVLDGSPHIREVKVNSLILLAGLGHGQSKLEKDTSKLKRRTNC